MKYTRVILIVVAAILCVAVSGFAHDGPGTKHGTLVMGQDVPVGYVDVHNTGKYVVDEVDYGSKLMVQITAADDEWAVLNAQAWVSFDPVPTTKKGSPIPGQFNRIVELTEPQSVVRFIYDLEDDFDFRWGQHHPHNLIVAVHADLVQVDPNTGQMILYGGEPIMEGAWSWVEDATAFERSWGWEYRYTPMHAMRGQFIDAPVKGLGYVTESHSGFTGDPAAGGYHFFLDEPIDFYIGPPPLPDGSGSESFYLGSGIAEKQMSPVDLYHGSDTGDPRVVDMARVLQTLDSDGAKGSIHINADVAHCFSTKAAVEGFTADVFGTGDDVSDPVGDFLASFLIDCYDAYPVDDDGASTAPAEPMSPDEAQGNLESGLNASGIFRKNASKTEDWAEEKHKEEVMPVYLPGMRSNGSPSFCDMNDNGIYDEGIDQLGVPYEEWRLNGDPAAESCDPRYVVDGSCVVTLIDCRQLAKPLLVTYLEEIDIYDDQVTTDFWGGRFAFDVYTAVSRDDGTTWKRMNVSRIADDSSIELETEEPFPGTCGSPYLKVDDNYILVVWESKFCKSGNPRYSITTCDDPDTPEIEVPADPYNGDYTGCQIVCSGPDDPNDPNYDPDKCEPDYPWDDEYYVTDVWGVRGQQQSVNYDEVDDVAELGIGEIPYSCLWAARGVIATAKELTDGTFESLNSVGDGDPTTINAACTDDGVPYACCTGEGTGDCDELSVQLGDIVWYKPERITSGRRDAYIPVVNSARGAGFAIAWQEDPDGLRPGKGKGPGEGWSGAISNHKTDIWYTFIRAEDFATIDPYFQPGGPGDTQDPDSTPGFEDKPGLGRPKAKVPFSLPVRVSDNDMVNSNTLKVQPSSDCVVPPNGTEPVCFPEVVDGTFVPLDEDEIAVQFCDHPDANPVTCCDPEHHSPDDPEYDPNCEDLKGLFGNLSGTKRYAYLAKTVDDNNDGVPDYQYYEDRGGTLDLCDLSGANSNSYMNELPGTQAHERWYGFTNASGASKLVCVTSDGRLLDGDVYASRPMLQLQPYTKADGTKSAWALLSYEESKGMGHSLVAAEHEDDGDEIIGRPDDPGQDKPIKQDLGKNLLYHSFDFTEPDLVAPGHIVNLPALCGGLYPAWCGEDYAGTNPTCFCDPGQPVPLYFDYLQCGDPNDPETCEWMPDTDYFLQFRTEIARRARFVVQSYGKMGPTRTAGSIIYKQGQEGQGRPADVFIRRFVVPTQVARPDGTMRNFSPRTDNPFAFENFECTAYLDETFALPGCPTDNVAGYNCNVWGEASGDRLCGGLFLDSNGGYQRRDHINLTSADIDLAVDAGPVDDTPDDPTDDIYGTNKVLLWSQHERNLGNESFGTLDGLSCDHLAGDICPGMYSNARSHRGFIRGDYIATAYSLSPNWAAGRNGNDRYNFYVRKSFDGGQTWTTDPAGAGVYVCPEFRTDPETPDPDGSGNLPPVGYDVTCGTYDFIVPDGELPPLPVGSAATNHLAPMTTTSGGVIAQHIPAGAFEPARNVSEIKSNKESSGDPRIGATPPTVPIDGTDPLQSELVMVEDQAVNNVFFVAWGTTDNPKTTGNDSLKTEGSPLDIYYTRTSDYGDNFLKVPWVIGGENSNQGYGETVWRYDYVAKGDPERQGECQLRATSDGSKMYAFYHQYIAEEPDPDEIPTRWYPWKPEVTFENDLWFRRVIFWPDDAATAPAP